MKDFSFSCTSLKPHSLICILGHMISTFPKIATVELLVTEEIYIHEVGHTRLTLSFKRRVAQTSTTKLRPSRLKRRSQCEARWEPEHCLAHGGLRH